jgi:hypothetical protein
MSRTKDRFFALLGKLARALEFDRRSLDYQALEDEFHADPAAVAKKYAKLLDIEEQRFLGYFAEVDPQDEEVDIEALRRSWPQPQPQPRIWSRDVFSRASGRRNAWLLGLNRYKRLPELKSPEPDVKAMAKLLSDPGLGHFESTVVPPAQAPEAKAVEKHLTDAIAASGEDDAMLIYYSGHGFSAPKGGGLYLAARDTDFARPDSAIDVNAITAAYGQSRCGSLLLVLDCCQSGGVALDVSRLEKKALRPRKGDYHDAFGRSGLRVLASSTQAQESLEDTDPNTGLSVFTGALVDGLRSGRADADHDGAVTDAEAFAYARGRLAAQRLLERQSPIHHVLAGETPFLLSLNEHAMALPSVYAIALEHIGMHVAVQAMAALVREGAPILFNVRCSKYYFREVKGVAIASGLRVSPIHTPFLRASQDGFVCETYFLPAMVPERVLEKRRPVNGLVRCELEVRFEDMLAITGRDFSNGVQWNLHVPPDTIITGGIGPGDAPP